MKLQILSDLHTEFAGFDPPQTDADVIILAGDIGVGAGGLAWAAEQFGNTPVVYVPGNHEYYGHDLDIIHELKGSAPATIQVLNDEQWVLGNVRFLCSTLWTDFELLGAEKKTIAMQRAGQVMNDFRTIYAQGARFTPAHSIRLHQASRAWLAARFAENFDGVTVVVTHHLPSASSVSARFKTDTLTPAFASELGGLMQDSDVALWIHGHTHDILDYQLNGTRVVCNPRGYPNEWREGIFDPGLVVSL